MERREEGEGSEGDRGGRVGREEAANKAAARAPARFLESQLK